MSSIQTDIWILWKFFVPMDMDAIDLFMHFKNIL